MSDAIRGGQCWDLVLIGCGKSKQAVQARAIDLYTGPVFAAHRAIVAHLGAWPYILSAEHGVLPAGCFVAPYEKTLKDLGPGGREKWDEAVGRFVAQMASELLAGRRYVGGAPGMRTKSAKKPEQREGDGRGDFAFGPPRQPSILVLAGAPYIDGWAGKACTCCCYPCYCESWGARALGVRIDDPLRGFELGERRRFAAIFTATTPRWSSPESWSPEDIGYTRREQLLAAVDDFEAERWLGDDPIPDPDDSEHVGQHGQMNLFTGAST